MKTKSRSGGRKTKVAKRKTTKRKTTKRKATAKRKTTKRKTTKRKTTKRKVAAKRKTAAKRGRRRNPIRSRSTGRLLKIGSATEREALRLLGKAMKGELSPLEQADFEARYEYLDEGTGIATAPYASQIGKEIAAARSFIPASELRQMIEAGETSAMIRRTAAARAGTKGADRLRAVRRQLGLPQTRTASSGGKTRTASSRGTGNGGGVAKYARTAAGTLLAGGAAKAAVKAGTATKLTKAEYEAAKAGGRKTGGRKSRGQKGRYGKPSLSRVRAYEAHKKKRKKKGRKASPGVVTVKLRAGRPMGKKLRESLISRGFLSQAGRVNPGHTKKKKRKKNPGHKNPGHKNPGLGDVATGLVAPQNLVSASHYLLGFSTAFVGGQAVCGGLSSLGLPVGGPIAKIGCTALAGGLGAAALAALQPQANRDALRGKGYASMKFFQGGAGRFLTATAATMIVQGIAAVSPQSQFASLVGAAEAYAGDLVTSVGLPAAPLSGMGDFIELRGLGQYPSYEHYPGQYGANVFPANMPIAGMGAYGHHGHHGHHGHQHMGDMGSATSPEALVAGESFARTVNEFHGMGNVGDFMEMRGMGDFMEMRGMRGMGQGGDSNAYRIPYNAIRAPGQLFGMGDFMEELPGGPLTQPQSQFAPAMESF